MYNAPHDAGKSAGLSGRTRCHRSCYIPADFFKLCFCYSGGLICLVNHFLGYAVNALGKPFGHQLGSGLRILCLLLKNAYLFFSAFFYYVCGLYECLILILQCSDGFFIFALLKERKRLFIRRDIPAVIQIILLGGVVIVLNFVEFGRPFQFHQLL